MFSWTKVYTEGINHIIKFKIFTIPFVFCLTWKSKQHCQYCWQLFSNQSPSKHLFLQADYSLITYVIFSKLIIYLISSTRIPVQQPFDLSGKSIYYETHIINLLSLLSLIESNQLSYRAIKFSTRLIPLLLN